MQSNPVLKVSDNEGSYDEYPLKLGINIIGRASSEMSNTNSHHYIPLRTTDTKISRKHFTIEWDINNKAENVLLLSDNNSANGTILKSYRETPLKEDDKIYLVHNDEIKAGDTSILIHIPVSLLMTKAIIVERSEDNIKTLTWGSKK
jgi:pSer/pThr/pTyr-binding forkhead associated (FHA) protein